MKEKRYLCDVIDNFNIWMSDHQCKGFAFIFAIILVISAIVFPIFENTLFKYDKSMYTYIAKNDYTGLRDSATALINNSKIDFAKILAPFQCDVRKEENCLIIKFGYTSKSIHNNIEMVLAEDGKIISLTTLEQYTQQYLKCKDVEMITLSILYSILIGIAITLIVIYLMLITGWISSKHKNKKQSKRKNTV